MERQLEILQQENDALRRENARLKLQVLRNTMERAVSDDQFSRVLRDRMDEFFGPQPGPLYVCILFHGGRRDPAETESPEFKAGTPLDGVSETFTPVLSAFGTPFFFETAGTVACLLNTKSRDNDLCQTLKEALSSILKQSGSNHGTEFISISNATTMADGPRLLFRAASRVSEHRTEHSPLVCVETETQAVSRDSLKQVYALEPLFWNQIGQQKFFSAATTLDQLIELSRREHGALERTLPSVFSRMELVLSTAIAETGGAPQIGDDFASLLADLSQARTYQDMRNVAYDILATLEDRFFTPPDARNRKMPDIEQFIRQHYTDQNLGAASLSETFRISTSYLSRIFKADMGIGVVDYIHQVRIDAAKTLLASTALTLDEIAVQVGFSNRWVFMRAFKRREGMTPGAFRTAANGASAAFSGGPTE